MKHWGTVFIETDKMILRRFTLEDVEPMYRNWASDPEVTRFLTWQAHYSPEVTRNILRNWVLSYKNNRYYQWAIVPKEVGEPIGSISIVKLDEDNETVGFGYCIGQEWWHQGYTSMALQVLIQFFFDKAEVQRIEASHAVENPNSGKVMEKCHMQQEGLLRSACKSGDGKFHDMKLYAILKEDYERLRRMP